MICFTRLTFAARLVQKNNVIFACPCFGDAFSCSFVTLFVSVSLWHFEARHKNVMLQNIIH